MSPNSGGWVKSSFSGQGPNCVQVRFVDGTAHVRDSKDLGGPVLVFNRGEWEAFEMAVFHGEFSMPE